MAKTIITLVIVFSISTLTLASTDRKLRTLYDQKQCFDLRDAIKSASGNSPEDIFYQGAVANQFNQPQQSIALLKKFLKRPGTDQELAIEARRLLVDDYRKTFQYRKAASALERLIERYGAAMDPVARADEENELKLCRALAHVPAQITRFIDDSIVLRDKEGNYPVLINDIPLSLAFDSGANISVITTSMARSLRLNLIDEAIDVMAIAGNKVKAKLAVAKKLRAGNVLVRNAVFLVFEDKDLYVAEANFQINGLIGFPVIASLRELTFVRGQSLIIPKIPNNSGEQNMCLDRQVPLVAGYFEATRLPFVLDTGATASTLYPSFFRKYESEITKQFAAYLEPVRGIGGVKEIKAYLAKDIVLTFSGQPARFTKLPVLIEETNTNSRYFYGNVGQDLISQFKSMTLDFKTMSVSFER